MDRRAFIKSLPVGSAVVLAPALSGCTADEELAYEAWNGPAPGEEDIRRIVLSYGLTAPNPHNTQAWIVALTGPDSFELYVDQTRLLPQTDPPYRQIHIGQGTFLENVVIAAGHQGRRAQVEYFPRGEYANTELARLPVAAVLLVEDEAAPRDPLFSRILARVSNKRAFSGGRLTQDDVDAVLQFAMPRQGFTAGAVVQFDLDPDPRLVSILTEAMRVEVADAGRAAETIEWFRFSPSERLEKRDGLSVAQTGRTGFAQWVAETFALRRGAVTKDPASFNEQTVTLTADQASSAAAFGWLATRGNARRDQVEAGRLYQRIALAADARGLALQPMSQVLQEYADMAELQREFLELIGAPEGATVQMLFRLGRASATPPTPRRRLDDLIQT